MNREREEKLFDKYENGNAFSNNEIEELLIIIKNKIKNGEIIKSYEIDFLHEMECPIDEEIVGVARHGYVIYYRYWEIDEEVYRSKFYYHDVCGSEFESQKFIPCVKKTIEVWRPANE